MKKTLTVHLIILAAALVAASVLAPVLQRYKKRINPDQDYLTASPVGGMHKVAADWEWIRFINYLGGLQTVDETNVKEVTERLERLVGLDPKFERLYLDGLSSIQHANPKKAVEILERACKMESLKNNWKIPFYTGFIYSRDTYDIKDQNGAPLMSANHAKAAEYFKLAILRNVGEPQKHLVNNYIRELAKAESVGTAPDREYLAKLRILYRTWRMENKLPLEPGLGGSWERDIEIPDLNDRLLKAIQEAKDPHDIYDQRFEPSKEVLDLIARIRREVLYEQELCPQCLVPTPRGAQFCIHCGAKLEFVHGVCVHCKAKLPAGAAFCQECGKKQEPDQPGSPKP